MSWEPGPPPVWDRYRIWGKRPREGELSRDSLGRLELCSSQCGLWSSIKVRGGLVGNADSQGPCPRLTELSLHFTKIPGDLSTTIWEKHEAERLRAVQRLTEHLVQNLGFRREAGAKHSGLFSRFYPERGQSVKNVLIRNLLVPQIANLSSRPLGR